MKKILFGLLVLLLLSVYYIQPASATEGDNPAQLLLPIVEEAESFASEGKLTKAKSELEEFHEVWEKVEASIKETSPRTYEETEAAMAKAEGLLQSNNPNADKTIKAIGTMQKENMKNSTRDGKV